MRDSSINSGDKSVKQGERRTTCEKQSINKTALEYRNKRSKHVQNETWHNTAVIRKSIITLRYSMIRLHCEIYSEGCVMTIYGQR